jgi:F0F1-type ATP synthase alpha subunit
VTYRRTSRPTLDYDGQIFLETNLFNLGCVHINGVSVSRVGGNAQIKSMKKWLVTGSTRLSSASWKPSPESLLTSMPDQAHHRARPSQPEILKQPQFSPAGGRPVAIIYAATNGPASDNVPVNRAGNLR